MTPEVWGVLALSLRVSLAAMAATLPVALALAYVLARARFPGKVLLDGLVHLPLVLPPVVTGLFLLMLFGSNGPAGRALAPFGISFGFNWAGAALASAVMGLPLMVRPIRLSLEGVDRRLENAAATLGAPPLWRLATVTLPLAGPGVLAGMALFFARSFGEFGATITFVGSIPGETRTLPLAVYALLQSPGGEAAALRLAGVSVVISLLALVASEALVRQGMRREADA